MVTISRISWSAEGIFKEFFTASGHNFFQHALTKSYFSSFSASLPVTMLSVTLNCFQLCITPTFDFSSTALKIGQKDNFV
jgi:hypothetical protein